MKNALVVKYHFVTSAKISIRNFKTISKLYLTPWIIRERFPPCLVNHCVIVDNALRCAQSGYLIPH